MMTSNTMIPSTLATIGSSRFDRQRHRAGELAVAIGDLRAGALFAAIRCALTRHGAGAARRRRRRRDRATPSRMRHRHRSARRRPTDADQRAGSRERHAAHVGVAVRRLGRRPSRLRKRRVLAELLSISAICSSRCAEDRADRLDPLADLGGARDAGALLEREGELARRREALARIARERHQDGASSARELGTSGSAGRRRIAEDLGEGHGLRCRP